MDLNEFNFTGDLIMIKRGGLPAENDIRNIKFISANGTTGWNITAAQSPVPVFIPAASNFTVESRSTNVTFSLVGDDGPVLPFTFVSVPDANVGLWFDITYLTTKASRFASPSIIKNGNPARNVTLYHPFSYYPDATTAFVADPPVRTYSYTNCSMCLSPDSDNCGLTDGYVRKENYTAGTPFEVPIGFRYRIFTRKAGTWIVVNERSPLDISIDSNDIPLTLTLDAMRNETDLRLQRSEVSLRTNLSRLDLRVHSFALDDAALNCSVPVTLSVATFADIDIDRFEDLTSGIFANGGLTVGNFLYLRDDQDAFLQTVTFGPTGCVLGVKRGDTTRDLQIPQDDFGDIRVGANASSPDAPKFIALQVNGTDPIRGGVQINIDASNVYLTVDSSWSALPSVLDRIMITSSPNISGRVVYDGPVQLDDYFNISQSVGILNARDAKICLWNRDSFKSCSNSVEHLLPRKCESDVCIINESRSFVLVGSNLKLNMADSITPTIEYPTGANLSMATLPENVSLTVGGAFGSTATIWLVFDGNATKLRGLAIEDPVFLSFPAQYSLSVDEFKVDFRSFRRCFKSTGFLASGILNAKRMLLDEETRYYKICIQDGGWQLIGNEDAWNTTLNMSLTAFSLLTDVPQFRVSGRLHKMFADFGLFLKRENALVELDESVLDIWDYDGKQMTIDSFAGGQIMHPFRVFPSGFISTNLSLKFTKPIRAVQWCLYRSSPDECSDSGFDKVKADPTLRVPGGNQFWLDLRTDCVITLWNESSESIITLGNNKSLEFDRRMSDEILETLLLTISAAVFNNSFGDFPIGQLTIDYPSFSSFSNTVTVVDLLDVRGKLPPGASQRGTPEFILLPGSSLLIQNAENLPVIEMITLSEFVLGNGNTTWRFAGQLTPLEYNQTVDATISAAAGEASPLDLRYQAGVSLRVTKGWNSSTRPLLEAPSDRVSTLWFDEAADFIYRGNFSVDPTTLGRMNFDTFEDGSLLVNSSVGLAQIALGDQVVRVIGIDINRGQWQGLFEFVHTETDHELQFVPIGDPQSISPGVLVALRPETAARITLGFEDVRSAAPCVVITGEATTVFCDGRQCPQCFEIGPGLSVVVAQPRRLTAVQVAGIIVASVTFMVVMVVIVVMFVKRKRGKGAWDYDGVPASKIDPTRLLGAVQL
jgi:hypothetical protein